MTHRVDEMLGRLKALPRDHELDRLESAVFSRIEAGRRRVCGQDLAGTTGGDLRRAAARPGGCPVRRASSRWPCRCTARRWCCRTTARSRPPCCSRAARERVLAQSRDHGGGRARRGLGRRGARRAHARRRRRDAAAAADGIGDRAQRPAPQRRADARHPEHREPLLRPAHPAPQPRRRREPRAGGCADERHGVRTRSASRRASMSNAGSAICSARRSSMCSKCAMCSHPSSR